MTSADDQYAVGEFGSDGSQEPFRVAVRLRATGWNLHDFDSRVGQDGVERSGELAGAGTHQIAERRGTLAEVGQQVAGLLRCPGSVGITGRAEKVDVAGVDLDDEQHVDPLQADGAVDMNEVAGKHRRSLSLQELPPAQVGVSNGRWRDAFRPGVGISQSTRDHDSVGQLRAFRRSSTPLANRTKRVKNARSSDGASGWTTDRGVHTMGRWRGKTTVFVQDDLDGSSEAETVSLGYQGRQYEIDLSAKNKAKT